jgi:ribonuclease HI
MKIIYSDGFTIGKNPSSIGGGYLLADENGNVIKKQQFNKPKYSNNEAELMGVVEATKIIENGGEIYTDSMNTIRWIKSCKFKARPDLKQFGMEAKINILEKNLQLIFIPREENLAGQIIEYGITNTLF